MGIIQKLFGKTAKSASSLNTIAAVETALNTLADERRDAQNAIISLLAKRHELLLVDGSDAEIAALDVKADQRRLNLERCDLIEKELLQRLLEIQNENHRKQWQDLVARHEAACEIFIEKCQAALGAQEAVKSIVSEAISNGFIHEARTFPEPMNYFSSESLEHFKLWREKNRPIHSPNL